MTELLQALIDKQDNFEIIGDQIALILANEVQNQKTLALAASKDPTLWDLRIYRDRANAFEQWLNSQADEVPIVNIWYDSGSFPQNTSNVVGRQTHDAIYNIDCYALGVSRDEPAGGHIAGDEEAANNLHRAIRLVRNILMASQNTYLQLRGTVWQKWIQSINRFQVGFDENSAQQIVGARISFSVMFNEFSPQFEGGILEFLSVDIKRASDGAILAEVDIDYT